MVLKWQYSQQSVYTLVKPKCWHLVLRKYISRLELNKHPWLPSAPISSHRIRARTKLKGLIIWLWLSVWPQIRVLLPWVWYRIYMEGSLLKESKIMSGWTILYFQGNLGFMWARQMLDYMEYQWFRGLATRYSSAKDLVSFEEQSTQLTI